MLEPRQPAALPAWQRWVLYGTGLAVLSSGLAWLLAHYGLSGQSAFGADEHPMARWALAAHGVAAYALLWAAGSLMPLHIRVAWRLRRNRTSGAVMGAMLTLLALTGLWLYYGSLAGRDWVSVGHWLLGLLAALTVWLHRWLGRRLRR